MLSNAARFLMVSAAASIVALGSAPADACSLLSDGELDFIAAGTPSATGAVFFTNIQKEEFWFDPNPVVDAANDTANIYALGISSPPATFYVNSGTTRLGSELYAEAIDFEMTIIVAGGATVELQADSIDALQIRNIDGYREVAQRAAALGFDGKWVLHPGQVEASNEIFSPSQEDYDHAELILDAYDYYTSEAGGRKGSAMLGDEMIDEASRKMALVISGKGRAAGMRRTSKFEIPTD